METHIGIAYGVDIELASQVRVCAITAEEWVVSSVTPENHLEMIDKEIG